MLSKFNFRASHKNINIRYVGLCGACGGESWPHFIFSQREEEISGDDLPRARARISFCPMLKRWNSCPCQGPEHSALGQKNIESMVLVERIQKLGMAGPAVNSCFLSSPGVSRFNKCVGSSSGGEHLGAEVRLWRAASCVLPAQDGQRMHRVSAVLSEPVTEASSLEDLSQMQGRKGRKNSKTHAVPGLEDELSRSPKLEWLKQEGIDLTSERTIWRINRAIGRCSSVGEALAVIEEMKAAGLTTINEGTYLALITVCRRQRQGDRALSILAAMKQAGVKPGMLTYNTLISCCQQSLRLEDAFKIKAQMEAEGTKPDVVTYTSLMALLVKANPVRGRTSPEQRFERAMGLYKEMMDRSILPDTITFNTLMYAGAQAKLPGKVLEVYRSMCKAGVAPNQFTFGILLESVGAGGRLKSALEVFNEMRAAGLAPQTSTYNFLLEACATAPQPNAKKAWALFDEMKKMENVTPNGITYSHLIAASCKGGDHAGAMKAYELMKEAGYGSAVTTSTYNRLIHSASMTSGLHTAFELYEKMQAEGFKPDVVTNSTLLSACARADDLPKALAISEEFKKMGIRPNQVVLHSLIGAFGNAGLLEDAIRTFRSMGESDEPPTAVSYSIIFNACFGKEGVDGILALKSTQKLLEVTPGIKTAMEFYREAVAAGIFKNYASEDVSRCDLRKNGRSATVVALLVWLSDVIKAPPSTDLVIIAGTGRGKEPGKLNRGQLPWKYGVIESTLKVLGLQPEGMNTLTLQALTVKSSVLQPWLSDSGTALLSSGL
ncbi:hypothetical protein R1sor_023793 [Riccia sorocarpa]|uniref:PROP1-like PPR domain-containing protein n=1 Tax=Riccia sorocarpa TaxID=122646 RepID=A0ABD3GNP2_9MARC